MNIDTDFGKCPWQTIIKLFKYRNYIAHGKSTIIEKEEIIPINKYDINSTPKFIESIWEEYCNEDNLLKSKKDIEDIINKCHEAGKFKDYPFVSGFQSTSANIFKE